MKFRDLVLAATLLVAPATWVVRGNLTAHSQLANRAPSAELDCASVFALESEDSRRLSDVVNVSSLEPGSRLRQLLEETPLGLWQSEPENSPIRQIHDQLNKLLAERPSKWTRLRASDRDRFEIELDARVSAATQSTPGTLEIRIRSFELGSWREADYDAGRDQGAQGDGVSAWSTRRITSLWDSVLKRIWGPNEGRATPEIDADLSLAFGAIADAAATAMKTDPSLSRIQISAKSLLRPGIQKLLSDFEFQRDMPWTLRQLMTHPKTTVAVAGGTAALWYVPLLTHWTPLLAATYVVVDNLTGLSGLRNWTLTLDLNPPAQLPTETALQQEAQQEATQLQNEPLPAIQPSAPEASAIAPPQAAASKPTRKRSRSRKDSGPAPQTVESQP